jgi:hypothetical protein
MTAYSFMGVTSFGKVLVSAHVTIALNNIESGKSRYFNETRGACRGRNIT